LAPIFLLAVGCSQTPQSWLDGWQKATSSKGRCRLASLLRSSSVCLHIQALSLLQRYRQLQWRREEKAVCQTTWTTGWHEDRAAIPAHLSHPTPRVGIVHMEAGSGHHHHEAEGKEIQPLMQFDFSAERRTTSKLSSISVWGHSCLMLTRDSKSAGASASPRACRTLRSGV